MKTYHKNPRRITSNQFDDLKESLHDLGDLSGIVHDLNSDEIIGGNQRSHVFNINHCEIELTHQADEPDEQGTVAHGFVVWRGKRYAYRQVRWTPRQAEQANIQANKLGGTWDWDILADQFEFDDLTAWGFSEDELFGHDFDPPDENPETGTDTPPETNRANELQAEWQTEVGQLWQIGEHRLVIGDCADVDVVSRLMVNKQACLVFADPPYGVSIGAKNRMLNSFQPFGRNLTDIKDDSLSPEDLKQSLLPAFVNVRETIMADDCTVFVTAPQGGDLGMMMMMMMMMADAGLKVRHVLIWKKNAPTFSMGRLDYDYQHEPILLTWGKRHKRPMLGRHKTSVWEIDKPRASPEHPTMKPVELVENALLNNSDANDIVCDPFAGSGTTGIACANLNRRARMIEISPAYGAVILERMREHTGIQPELIE